MKKSIIYVGLGGLVLYLALKLTKENKQILVAKESDAESIPNQGNGKAPLVPPMTVVTPLTDGNGVVVRDEVKDPPAPLVEPIIKTPTKQSPIIYPKPPIVTPQLGDPIQMDFPIGISPILTPPVKPSIPTPIKKPIIEPIKLGDPTKRDDIIEPIFKPILKPLPTPAPPMIEDANQRPVVPMDFGIYAPVLETGNLKDFTIRKDSSRLQFSDF
jgi:hypothetical protein